MRLYFLIKVIIGIAGSSVSCLAVSATAWLDTSVERTFTVEGAFGECMFKPSVSLVEKGLNCTDGWVTLDCAGTLGGSKSGAMLKYNEIVLARVTDNNVWVRVDDSKKINGWCLGDRVQAFPLPDKSSAESE